MKTIAYIIGGLMLAGFSSISAADVARPQQPPQENPAPSVEPVTASSLNAYDAVMLADMNAARKAEGLLPLRENAALDRAAADKVKDMQEYEYFGHVGSDGQMSWHWISSEGYAYTTAGENLAQRFADPQDAFEAYMNSPGHREHILSPEYIDVGLASENGLEAVEFGSTL